MITFDAVGAAKAAIQWIQNWFETESGQASGAVIGISGGKDSAVAAALLCRALGKEHVFGVLMPNGEQRDIEDSRSVIQALELPHCIVNIADACGGLLDSLAKAQNAPQQVTSPCAHTKTNIPPRLRMTVLYAIGQELRYRVCGTGNLSERYVGYATKWGDTACDFNPLASFTATQVVEIGRALGLPEHLVAKAPADGLSGKTDEENLGFSYAALDSYLLTGTCTDSAAKEKIDRLHLYNAHKVKPIPIFDYFAP